VRGCFLLLGVWAKVRVDESKQLRTRPCFFPLSISLCVCDSISCMYAGAPLFNSNGFLRAGMAQNYYTSPSLLFGNLIIGPRECEKRVELRIVEQTLLRVAQRQRDKNNKFESVRGRSVCLFVRGVKKTHGCARMITYMSLLLKSL